MTPPIHEQGPAAPHRSRLAQVLSGAWLGLGAAALLMFAPACTTGFVVHNDYGVYIPERPPIWSSEQAASYRVGLPGPEWKVRREQGMQVVWTHDGDPAAIQVFSECQGHGDSDLEDFTDHQRIDYTRWEIIEEPTGELDAEGRPRMAKRQFYLTLAGRDALRTSVRANLDGEDIRIDYVVLKKNGCLFDLTYIAVPGVFDNHLDAFQRVIDGFAFPIKR